MIMSFDTYINEADHHDNIPAENQGGNCYTKGYDYFMKNSISNKNLRLCHGLVTGQGPIKGIKYNHCWCEDTRTGNVIDNTMPEFFRNVPIEVYYHIGKIDPDDVFKYDRNQVRQKAIDFRTYGPWENKLLDNEY